MVAAAASPAPHAAAGRPHPTYTKMITRALTELGGASARPAIAEHIIVRYSGLPARHDDLLSAHLRRLVAEGVLRTHGAGYVFDPPPPSEKKRGPGRPPRKDTDASTPVATAVPVKLGEKRGRGRPRKNPLGSSEKATLSAHTAGIAAPSVLPAKRKQLPGEDDPSVTTHEAAPTQAGARATEPTQEEVGDEEARIFQNGADATPVQSGGASEKRGRGRPRKDKPSQEAAAMSPTAAASRGFKRGCGRPSVQKPSAAASYENGVSAAMGIKTGGRTPRTDKPAAAETSAETSVEELAAAVAAMSAEGNKKRKRLRKEKPAAPAGVKRSRGRPRKDQCVAGLVEAAVEELFRDVMTEASTRQEEDLVSGDKMQTGEGGVALGDRKENRAGCVPVSGENATTEASTRREEEDLVSGDKMQTEEGGVAPGDRNETRAGCVPVSVQNAASAPVGAMDSDLGPADLADDVASTGVKRGRGRPRKNKPPVAMSAEAGDAASAGIEAVGGTPRMEESSAARSPETGNAVSTGVKRGRGRPKKDPAAAMVKRPRGRPIKHPAAAKTGDAVSKWVKGGRGRHRKKLAPPAEGKRGRGRPRKDQSCGTVGSVEAAGEVLFRDVAEGPGDSVLAGKTQTEGVVAPGDRRSSAADAGCVPASGENGGNL